MRRIARWLVTPYAMLGGLAGGAAFGVFSPDRAAGFTPVAQLYLGLLQMCVLPVIITAVTGSLARLLRHGEGLVMLPRLGLTLGGGLLVAALVALLSGAIIEPGAGIGANSREFLAKEVLVQETAAQQAGAEGLWTLAGLLIPSNVIKSAAENQILAVLVFSILLGLALGRLDKTQNSQAVEVLEAFYNAFIIIMGWIMVALPFGLFALMSSQAAANGPQTFMMMGALVGTIHGIAVIMFLAMTALISWRTRLSPWAVVVRVRQPLLTALGTGSSLASLPAALRSAESGLGIKKETAQLVLPIGFSLHPVGNVVHVIVSCLFILQLYGIALDIESVAMVMLGGIIVACAMAGTPGVASLSLLAALLSPLGVPAELAVVLLVAIDPILDPVVTLMNVQGNITAATIAAPIPTRTSADDVLRSGQGVEPAG